MDKATASKLDICGGSDRLMYDELVKRLQDFAAGTMRDKDAQLAFDAANAIEEAELYAAFFLSRL